MSVWCLLVGFLAGMVTVIPVLAIKRGHPSVREREDFPPPSSSRPEKCTCGLDLRPATIAIREGRNGDEAMG